MIVSFIIPALNEAATIQTTLDSLQTARQQGHEVILVDGGSSDKTIKIAETLVDQVINSPTGRAVQMNIGAAASQGNILCFLHSDTMAPQNIAVLIVTALSAEARYWGRFNIHLSGASKIFRVIETFINWRSRLTGIATGDQGIFVERSCFDRIGGFPSIPLMEDIQFSSNAKSQSSPVCLRETLITSSRRWERSGILHTIFLMWRLRAAYFFGVSAERIAEKYRNTR